MKIHFIGCSNANPHPGLGQSGLLLECDARYYLFDCGDAVATKMWLDAHLDWGRFSAVFFSHLHPDHLGGLFCFLLLLHQRAKNHPAWRLGTEGTLPIYIPDKRAAKLTAALMDCMHSSFPFHKRFYAFNGPNVIYQDRHLSVEAYPVRHSRGSHFFCIRGGGKRILYSGDICGPEEIAVKAEGSDAVIVEGCHYDLKRLAPALSGRGIKKIFITHRADKLIMNQAQALRAVRPLARETDLVLVRDGMTFKV